MVSLSLSEFINGDIMSSLVECINGPLRTGDLIPIPILIQSFTQEIRIRNDTNAPTLIIT